MQRFTLSTRERIGLLTIAVVLVLNTWLSLRNIAALDRDAGWVTHTCQVQVALRDLESTAVSAQNGVRGYIAANVPSLLVPFEEAREALPAQLERIRLLTGDNPVQHVNTDTLQERVDVLMAALAERIRMRQEGTDLGQILYTGRGETRMKNVRAALGTMEEEEMRLLGLRDAQAKRTRTTAVVTGIVSGALGLLVLGLFIRVLVRTNRERTRATEQLFEQEQWFRTTLGSIGDAVMATDAEGRITYINDVAAHLTGWGRDQAKGRPLEEVFPIVNEDTRLTVDNPVAKVRATGTVVGLANHTILLSRNGREWPIDDSAAPIRDKDGALIGVVLVFHDVTEQRRNARELRESQARLSESDRRKGEFIAILAHELRNPLAPLTNGLELVKLSDGNAEQVHALVPMMERQLALMVRLIDDLLDVTRISHGKIDLRKSRMDLREAAQQAEEGLHRVLRGSGHTLVMDLPATEVPVQADAARLVQVVGNLLNNACKFTRPGGTISLSIIMEGDQALLQVRDTGIGMDQEEMLHIFTLFAQADSAKDGSRGGLGIGLTLVKWLVEMHGGKVEAFSEGHGTGSTFTVRLPLASALPPEEGVPGRTERPIGTKPKRVLVVDDNRDAAESVAELLRHYGHRVSLAFNGSDAVVMAAREKPEAVVMDIGMPGLTGYEAAREMRITPGLESTLLIALTGWGQQRDRERSAAAGFDAHLVKPTDIGRLNELIARAKA